MKRVVWRLVPFPMLCNIFVSRTGSILSIAALPMGKQLGLSVTDYGLAARLFFITYALLGIHSNLLLNAAEAGFSRMTNNFIRSGLCCNRLTRWF